MRRARSNGIFQLRPIFSKRSAMREFAPLDCWHASRHINSARFAQRSKKGLADTKGETNSSYRWRHILWSYRKVSCSRFLVGSAALTGLTGLGRVARLHNRAPAARPSAGCATEAVITSHDLAIVDLWWVHIPEK